MIQTHACDTGLVENGFLCWPKILEGYIYSDGKTTTGGVLVKTLKVRPNSSLAVKGIKSKHIRKSVEVIEIDGRYWVKWTKRCGSKPECNILITSSASYSADVVCVQELKERYDQGYFRGADYIDVCLVRELVEIFTTRTNSQLHKKRKCNPTALAIEEVKELNCDIFNDIFNDDFIFSDLNKNEFFE